MMTIQLIFVLFNKKKLLSPNDVFFLIIKNKCILKRKRPSSPLARHLTCHLIPTFLQETCAFSNKQMVILCCFTGDIYVNVDLMILMLKRG